MAEMVKGKLSDHTIKMRIYPSKVKQSRSTAPYNV